MNDGVKKISKISDRLYRGADEIMKVTTDELVKNADLILRLNKKQLAKGEESKGIKMKQYLPYSPNTQAYADRDGINKPKSPSSPVTLNWFGDFWSSFFLTRVSDTEIMIDSKDEKSDSLDYAYGKKLGGDPDGSVFGLNEENKADVGKKILGNILSSFKRKIGIK